MLKLFVKLIGSEDDAVAWFCAVCFVAVCCIAAIYGLPGGQK